MIDLWKARHIQDSEWVADFSNEYGDSSVLNEQQAKEIALLHNAAEYQQEYGIYAVPHDTSDGKVMWQAFRRGRLVGLNTDIFWFPTPAEAICVAGEWLTKEQQK